MSQISDHTTLALGGGIQNRDVRALQVYDPVLTNLARSYRPSGFIADELMADIPVKTLSGQYPIFTKQFWFQNDVDFLVRDRAPAKEIDFEWSLDTYLAEEYAAKVSITDLEEMQALGLLRLRQNKQEFLSHRFSLSREIRIAALLRKTTNGGGLNLGAAPSVNWDQATAVIEADIQTGSQAIYDATGQAANTIVIPWKVAYAMATQEDIRAIIQYEIQGGNGQSLLKLGDKVLPPVIHGMRVVIPKGAQKDTSREGGTESISEIWGDHVRLLYVDKSAAWGTPSVAYRFRHTAPTITRWRTVDPDVEYVREMERLDEKVVAPDVGYEIASVLS